MSEFSPTPEVSAAPASPPPAPDAATGATPLSYAGPAALKGQPYVGPTPTKDDTNMGMLIYILGLVTGFVGPLILWLVKKNESKFIDDQGKEVLNFQITFIIAYIIAMLSMFILIGFVLVPALIIAYVVFMILGAINANKGIAYRFPFALRLIK